MSEENKNVEILGEVVAEQDLIGKRFNWGAFGLTWIWGLGNKVWITLIIIPIWFLFMILSMFGVFSGLLGEVQKSLLMVFLNLTLLGIQIWFGINGNKWAWAKKKYKSVEAFHKIQRIWAVIAVSLIVVDIVYVIMTTLPALTSNTNDVRTRTMIKRHVVTVDQATRLMEAVEEKCVLTSEKMAECFAGRLNINALYGKNIKLFDGAVYEFHGDGACVKENACYVLIDVNGNGKTIKLPLYVKVNGYLEVKQADVDKFFVE